MLSATKLELRRHALYRNKEELHKLHSSLYIYVHREREPLHQRRRWRSFIRSYGSRKSFCRVVHYTASVCVYSHLSQDNTSWRRHKCFVFTGEHLKFAISRRLHRLPRSRTPIKPQTGSSKFFHLINYLITFKTENVALPLLLLLLLLVVVEN